MSNIIPYEETHQQGTLSIENLELHTHSELQKCDFGVQISRDGRVWICVNGIAFLRFTPHPDGKMKKD